MTDALHDPDPAALATLALHGGGARPAPTDPVSPAIITASSFHADPASIGFSAAALLAPFRAIGRFMIALAEASPQMRALNRLSQMSDAELSAKGLTRDGEVRRILGGSAAL